VWNTPHWRPLALPAALVGALGGWGWGVCGAYYGGKEGIALACSAGGNIAYEAGHVLIGLTREAMESLQRRASGQVGPVITVDPGTVALAPPSGPGPVINIDPGPVASVPPSGSQPDAVAEPSSAASSGGEPVPVGSRRRKRRRNVNPGAAQAPRHAMVQP
jgi:hypothetical protein